MRLCSVVLFALLMASVAVAGDGLCDPAKAETVDQDAGVVVQKVTLSGPWGRNSATIFLPRNREAAVAGVVFSHSVIRRDDGTSVDLLPFAMTLAKAEAAVIVPERSLVWPPTDMVMNREAPVVLCAAHWIVDNAKLVNNGDVQAVNAQNHVMRVNYGYVGPALCDPISAHECRHIGPLNASTPSDYAYHRHPAYVPLGEPENAVTDRIISDRGLREAQWLQRWLGLARIDSIVASPSASNPQ